ncbi:hypothetical protein PIROE2DRAFT_58570 [Piromyces sp. E2]|nr:hypothetical protein PIROE2DRAFT_58570 [Piromyces sp. E2]|eukprot:OUM67697.1 hypothetical protein PIROE2DRAFT_58570 [Piromyces sp. E2]
MNFKKICLILPFCLKVFSVPVTELTNSESDDEIIGENFNLNGDDVQIVDIFSEDENVATEIITSSEEECSTKECIETSKYILSNMDTSVNPCENFYQYVCGGWENENKSKKDIFGNLQSEVDVKKEIEI